MLDNSLLTQRLISIREYILHETATIETMMQTAYRYLIEPQSDIPAEVDRLEQSLDELDTKIEEQCIAVIARFHPEAKDLRRVLMYQKIDGELERTGDLIANIVRNAHPLRHLPLSQKTLFEIPFIAEQTAAILRQVFQMMIDEDLLLYPEIRDHDKEIDQLNRQIADSLKIAIQQNQVNIDAAFAMWRIASYYERISDLATNLAEETYYLVAGKDLKHNHEIEDNPK